MSVVEDADARRAWRVARYAAALACLGLSFDLADRYWLGAPHWIELVAIAVSGGLFVWLWSRRDRPSLWLGNLAFLTLNAMVIASLWVSSQRVAESRIDWVPFRSYQLGALAVALLAPPTPWVGMVTIIAFIGTAVVQFAMFDPSIREHLPYGDPWTTLAFGLFAMGLLMFRLHASRIEREVARVQAEMASLQRFARAMLAVRDLANTPLQTLTIISELLRAREPDTHAIADCIERAVTRLGGLERVASKYEDELEWRPGDESFDPGAILKGTGRDGA